MDPLVSVIVPVYKVEEYLPRCVDSILAQTYSALEIILVDDGSPDSSGEICQQYAEQDDRILVIHQENAGIGPTRNTGLSLCTGEYVVFVDSDDYLPPKAIQTLYDRLREDGSDLAIGDCVKAYEDNSHGGPYFKLEDCVLTKQELFSRMEKYNSIPVSPWGKLYRRTILEGVSYPAIKIGEDMLAFPDIIEHCTRISLVGRPVYFYFQRGNSLMRQQSEVAKLDNLYATLHTARHLLTNGYRASAVTWYGAAIKLALTVKSRRQRLSLFERFFDRATRRALQKSLDLKCRLVWLALHIPFVYYIP